MNTPWGASQQVLKLERGVSWVSTAGHGGFMVSRGAAEKLLTEQARAHATERYGDYFAFEEDCDYAIVLFEHPEYDAKLGGTAANAPYEVLSRWNPKYLIDRGFQPVQKEYEAWLDDRERDKLRAEKSPELIVAAWGDWAEWVPQGQVGVQAADDKRYLVPNGAYPARGYRLAAYPERQEVA